MSEELLNKVQEMLKEEKWTRATIINYSKSSFEELASIVKTAKEQDCVDDVRSICDDYLAHTKNSIIALYISGMLGLKRSLDNSAINELISIFVDNKKTDVVEFLCTSILEEDETNKPALRTLADCYKESNNDKIWEIYEKLVKLDLEEADSAKILGDHYEQNGDVETAVDYYKKALLRYVAKKSNNQIKEVWTKLVSLIPEEIDYFKLVQNKIQKTISEEKSAILMQELYVYYKDNKKWDTAIEILKLLLKIDEKDNWARKEIVECFREKYSSHSQLEECIRVSNLSQGWRNVFEAISDFEKHIAFDKDNFVFHKSWGVGKIIKVSNDKIKIFFGKKYGAKIMDLKMAVDALKPLANDHIWVLKATKQKNELQEVVKNDISGTLKIIIKSFDNSCDFKTIKAELVPLILSPSEWISWNSKAKRIIESDATFGVNPDDINKYQVRSNEVTKEEKLANEFKAQKNFFDRIDILMRFINTADTDSELFTDMYNYFSTHLKSFATVSDETIASYLICRRISTELPHLAQTFKFSFAQLFDKLEKPEEIYVNLKDTANTTLRQDYLDCIKLLPNWNEVYIKLFPTVLKKKMIDDLLEGGFKADVQKLVADSFENFIKNREAVIFFFKESQNEEWFKEIKISEENQYITLIHIIDVNFKEIENHYNTTENKKIIGQIMTLLFKEDRLLNYMLENDRETVTRIFSLIEDIPNFEHTVKMKIRNRILEKYPDFKFHGTEEKTVAVKGLIVTSKMLPKKKAELEHLMTVEIPAIAKEVAEAREKGDLRENAEYKVAKERQAQLDTMAKKLDEEIKKSNVFDPSTITTSRISFGTIAELEDSETKKIEKFTILGPWESDPDNNIISYKSPFGNAILNGKQGQKLDFTINERKYSYIVKSIKKASF